MTEIFSIYDGIAALQQAKQSIFYFATYMADGVTIEVSEVENSGAFEGKIRISGTVIDNGLHHGDEVDNWVSRENFEKMRLEKKYGTWHLY